MKILLSEAQHWLYRNKMKIISNFHFRNYKKITISLMLVLCLFVQKSSAQIHRWTPTNDGLTNLHVLSLASVSDKIIFAGTPFGMFCSTNSGLSWSEKSLGLDYLTIESLGSNHHNYVYAGISGGDPPYDLHSECVMSNDTANTWQNIDIGYSDYNFMSISDADSTNIFATIWGVYNFLYGGNHYVIQTTDGGYSWETKKTFIDNSSSIANPILTYDSLILVGRADPPNLFRSTDLGTTWQELYIDSSSFPPAVLSFCYNDQGIFFAGTTNKIFRSTDFGLTWHILPQSPDWIFTMCCEGESKILAVKNGVTYSSDLGSTWNPDTIGIGTTAIRSILQYAPGKYLLGTYEGVYSSGLLNENEEKIIKPSVFSLSQNYPNPFNPVTIIKYEIASGNFISIKVYDILGKEIQTLINEYKPAGSYKVNFVGNNLPSGLYFYRINAGNYSAVKKMILLR